MDSKKVIEKLIKIAEQQQKIIQKLAQVLPPDALPTSATSFNDGKEPGAVSAAPPNSLAPAAPSKREAETILTALPAGVKPAVANIEVRGGSVYITFQPGKATQQVYEAVKNVVQQLQNANRLPQQNYQVHVAE